MLFIRQYFTISFVHAFLLNKAGIAFVESAEVFNILLEMHHCCILFPSIYPVLLPPGVAVQTSVAETIVCQ